jgi:hypothetical protein
MELLPLSATAVEEAPLAADAFDQDAPHGGGGCREEMAAVISAGGDRADESHVGLVHQRRRIQAVAGGFSTREAAANLRSWS